MDDPGFARIFRAFVWMRFRVLVNSLERTGARDTLERFSVAIDKLGPILALTLLIPSSLVLFVLGITTGFALAMGDSVLSILFVRYFLLLALALTVFGPVILPTRDSGAIVRLVLLPIPRVGLYVAQMAGSIADPWILLIVPVVIGIPVGLAVGLKFIAAAMAVLAGVAFMLLVTGLTSLAASVIHLLLRDRRRGDLVMLVMVFLLPVISIVPQILLYTGRGPSGREMTRAERRAQPPTATARAAGRLAPFVPSEMYQRTVAAAVPSPLRLTVPLGELAAVALLIQAAGFAAYRRVLDMPVSLGTRRAGSFGGLWDRAIPGLSAGASAVAFTQLRLALRTPRGRATIATPVLLPLLLGGLYYSRGSLPFAAFNAYKGLVFALVGAATSILALLPIGMNQFAVDKAGFTRQMLSPIGLGDLLAGKAVGNAIISAIPAAFCFFVAAVVMPGGHPSLWLAVPLGFVATHALLAPAAAALSAVFPKTVDLNSIGNGSNAHPAAGILGMLGIVVSAGPPIVLALLTIGLLHRPGLAGPVLLVWCAVALGLSRVLFIPVRRLLASRCETLAQYY